ncbi:MAG: hypothetical protein EOM17_08200, partial [Synergistales bacterium]|nr:hypothetical protein [Synergistales bacterium]
NKIKQWFNKERREENIVQGKASFEAELRHANIAMAAVSAGEVLPQVLKKVSFNSLDEMYAAIGYGGMLLEGLVAVIAIGTVMISGSIAKGGPTITYAEGLGQFAGLIGISPAIGTSMGLLALNSFLLTSLDTATRLARYQLQELTGMKLDRYTATIVGVALAMVLLFYKTGGKPAWALIWPVFGAANQLVAALALLAIGVWITKGLKKDAKFVMIPMVFMLVTTVAALFLLIKANLNNLLLSGMSVVLLVLAIMLVKEAWDVLKSDDLTAAKPR